MSLSYQKQIGRIRVEKYISENYVTVSVRDGFPESFPTEDFRLSLEEVRDLQYLFTRMMAHAERES